MEGRLEKAMSVALTVAAVVIAGSLARREFFPGTAQAVPAPRQDPTPVTNWDQVLAHGVRIGPSNAPVVVVTFADLECPFCRLFYQDIYRSVERRFQGQVALVHVDFPITGHRFARPAARAAACAKDAGLFGPFVEQVYSHQDSLGLKSWTEFASAAGIRDTAAFRRCAASSAPMPFLDSAAAFGRRMGVRGTPTVLVNGWRFPAAPTESTLSVTIERMIRRVDPFPELQAKK